MEHSLLFLILFFQVSLLFFLCNYILDKQTITNIIKRHIKPIEKQTNKTYHLHH